MDVSAIADVGESTDINMLVSSIMEKQYNLTKKDEEVIVLTPANVVEAQTDELLDALFELCCIGLTSLTPEQHELRLAISDVLKERATSDTW